MRKSLVFWVFISLGVLEISGCAVEDRLPTPTDTRPPPTLTHTSTATQTPTLTLTFTQSPALTFTPTNTLTPIPTLSSDSEKDAYVIGLIETNGGCELPCFLGIEAGVSTWHDVRNVYQPLTHLEIPFMSDTLNYFRIDRNIQGYRTIGFNFYTESDFDQIDYITTFFSIEQLEPGAEEYIKTVKRTFSLVEIVGYMGIPSNVYLFGPAQPEPDSGILANMVLVYVDYGLAIEYFFWSSPSSPSDYYRVDQFCYFDNWLRTVRLSTISLDSGYSLSDRTQISERIERRTLRDFQEVTDLDMEDFYGIVMSGDTEPCFQLVNP